MNRFGFISRMVENILAEVKSLGGVTQNRFISPKGLYSKPKGENALIINLSNGRNQDVIMALQKEIDLEDGDVILTDDKSYFHFRYKDGNTELTTNALTIKAKKVKFDGCEVDFVGGYVKHNGTSIDDTHTHSQDADSAGNSQVESNPPS